MSSEIKIEIPVNSKILIIPLAQNTCLLSCASFGSLYTKIGTIQRRLAWPLRKDDTQNREAFQIFEHLLCLGYKQHVISHMLRLTHLNKIRMQRFYSHFFAIIPFLYSILLFAFFYLHSFPLLTEKCVK